MLEQLVSRFLVGGGVAGAFPAVGEAFRPQTFNGAFAAAPSVAFASLGLGPVNRGSSYLVAVLGMVVCLAAMLAYARASTDRLATARLPARVSTTAAWLVWLVAAFGIWTVARAAVAPW